MERLWFRGAGRVIVALVLEAGEGMVGMIKQAGVAVALLNITSILYGLVVGRLCGLNHAHLGFYRGGGTGH